MSQPLDDAPLPVDRALSLLVNAARVSPPLRDAVAVVEDEVRRLKAQVDRIRCCTVDDESFCMACGKTYGHRDYCPTRRDWAPDNGSNRD